MLYYIYGNDSNKSRNVCYSYTIGGVQLPVKTETSDLGVIFDSKLRFDKHIASIVNKAHARAALIRRCFRSKDFILLFHAFTVFVRQCWNISHQFGTPIVIVMLQTLSQFNADLQSILVHVTL